MQNMLETGTYEDLKNNESVRTDNNLKILIKEIDELKDFNKDNDKIEWVFTESSNWEIIEKTLNKGLLDSLNKQDIWVLQILVWKVWSIYKESNLNLSVDTKQSVKNLLKLLTEILNKKQNNQETKNNNPCDVSRTIEWIWKFENKNFTFNENIIKWENSEWTYIQIEWKTYHEYRENANWLWYYFDETGLYIWNIVNGIFEWQWSYTWSSWGKYEWEFKNSQPEWQWAYTRQNWTAIKWTFNSWRIQIWTATVKTNWNSYTYRVERDYKWIRIISTWDNEWKYIDDATWEIMDTPTQIKDLTQDQLNNIEKIRNLWIKVYSEDFDKIKDLTQENFNNIKIIKELWIDIDNIEDICKLENFEQDILRINNEKFYEWYNYTTEEIEAHHHYKKWRIIENIQSYVQDIIRQNRNIWKAEIIEKIRSDLITLPINEKLNIIIWINKIVEKFNTVRKYLNFKDWPYKTPKDLLCAMRGISDPNIIAKISNNITVKQHWIWLIFFVWEEESYQTIYDWWLENSWESSWWVNFAWSEAIPDLEWTLSVVNWEDPGTDTEDYRYWAIWHEWQHNRNSYFMPDKDEWPITYAKDEITAFLRDWRWIFNEEKRGDTIEQILTEHESEWWLYQYELEWAERENHKEKVRELLWYANDLINLTKNPETLLSRDRVISMLSDTPVERRKELHDNIMKAIEDGNIAEKLWRNWSAEKETEIDEINLANSIQEIKHILNNPKYSHISWIPNNKWWIEISAMIDEVVAWKLDISYIPIEIRQQVQKFINQ